MAYRTLDDDEAQRLTGTGSVGATSVAGGAPASAVAPGAATPAAPASRFVGFNQYLSANRTAADATANRIADGVDAAQQRAQDAAGAVRSEVDTTPADPAALFGRAATRVRGVGNVNATPQPRGVQQGADAASYDAYATAAREAQQATANTGTTGGLQQLIGTGSGGAGRFDAGLVGAAGAGRFAAQRSRYADLAASLDPATYTRQEPVAAAAPAQRSAPARQKRDPRLDEIERRRQGTRTGGF